MESGEELSAEKLTESTAVYYDPQNGAKVEFSFSVEGKKATLNEQALEQSVVDKSRLPRYVAGIKRYLEAMGYFSQ